MTIELFKRFVEQKQDINDLVVLKYDKDPFLADHYLQRILRYSEYEFISELTPFLKKSNNIFGEAQDILYIHRPFQGKSSRKQGLFRDQIPHSCSESV